MKARICEVCHTTINETAMTSMCYFISISGSDNFEADTPAEKHLLLNLDDVCMGCTAKINAAIKLIVKGAKKK